MIALEVSCNRKKRIVAGAEDLSVLNAIITATGKLGCQTDHKVKNELGYDLFLHVGGLSSRRDGKENEHLKWVFANLRIGDEISVRIIETERADAYKESKSADKKSKGIE